MDWKCNCLICYDVSGKQWIYPRVCYRRRAGGNDNLQPGFQLLGNQGKRIFAGKNIVSCEQTFGVDSPFVERPCGVYKKDGEKSLTVFKKTIEKNLESS